MISRLHPLPVNTFAMVLGMAGLGLSWRYGATASLLPGWPGESMLLVAGLLWIFLVYAYIYKWIYHRQAAADELHHTIQCCFISLIPITTLLIGMGLLPYAPSVAWVLFLCGILGQLVFAAYRSAGLWRGIHVGEATTPIIYLPTVATNFVSASVMGATGHPVWGTLFFGAGMLSWISLEAAILHRLRTMQALAAAIRPVLGIQLAPAFVGCTAYLAINGGRIDIVALILVGYGILQALFLVRLFPWIAEGGFSPAFWAFSFGLASMAGCGLRFVAQHNQLPGDDLLSLGWVLFWAGSLCIFGLLILTIRHYAALLRKPSQPVSAA